MKAFLLKIIIPALIAVSIKLALQNQKKRITFLDASVSIITGIGSAYLLSDWVTSSFESPVHSIIIAIIAISGEKIGHYAMNNITLDGLIDLLKRFKK